MRRVGGQEQRGSKRGEEKGETERDGKREESELLDGCVVSMNLD